MTPKRHDEAPGAERSGRFVLSKGAERFGKKKNTRHATEIAGPSREGDERNRYIMKTNQKKVPSLSLPTSVRVRSRGASMVEYALLLVAVLVLSAVAFKSLGEKIKTSVNGSAELF